MDAFLWQHLCVINGTPVLMIGPEIPVFFAASIAIMLLCLSSRAVIEAVLHVNCSIFPLTARRLEFGSISLSESSSD
jgi:hypothetical protein